jgi:hypothetical protein
VARSRFSLLVPACVFVSLVLPASSYASDLGAGSSTCGDLGCLTLGIGGAGGPDLAPALGVRGGLSHSWGWRLVTVRAAGAWDAWSAHPMSDSASGSLKRVADVSLLGGAVARRRWGSASISAGVGVVWGRWDRHLTDPCRVAPGRDFTAIGFPVEAELFLTPVPGIGVGASWLTNFNPESTYTMLLMSFQFVATGVPEGAVLRDTASREGSGFGVQD